MSIKMQERTIVKSLSYSVLANGMNLGISVLVSFIIPKILGVREYSYWQLYSFYISYVGFFHFGWADGIYLRFGGEKYENLDKQYFATQFWLLVILEAVVCTGVGLFSSFVIDDTNKSFILTMTGLCAVIQIPRTFLQYLLQTTGRISDYAKNFMLEKIIYAIAIFILVLAGKYEYKILLWSDLLSKLVTLLLLCHACKDIVKNPMTNVAEGCREAWVNVGIGAKLMFANIASMLIIGVVRLTIENYWNVETFGKVSLTITISNMFMVFINAVSVVMYPLLKNTDEDRLPNIYAFIRLILMIPVFGILLLYYPAKILLSMWLPQYAESFRYMALLLPMCVYESKTAMLINTYLKALRKENLILKINCVMVILSVFSTSVLVFYFHDLILTVASLVVLLAIRSMVGEFVLEKTLHLGIWKNMFLELGLAFIFIVASWNIQSVWCVPVYAFAYAIYLLMSRKDLRQTIVYIRRYQKNR